MKKLLFIILFLPIVSMAQYELADPIYDLKPSVLNFEKFNGSKSDYELPYLRYCLKKCSQFREYGYVTAGVSVGVAMIPAFYTEKKYHESNPAGNYTKFVNNASYIAGGFGITSLAFFITGEVWLRKSSIKPTLSDDGIGVVIKF